MSAVERDDWTRLLAVFGLILLAMTAGCAGLGSSDQAEDSPSQTDEGNSTDDSGDSNASDDDSSPEAPETGLGEFGDLDPAATDRTAKQLLADSADALAAVDSYSLEQRVVNVRGQNNQTRRIRVNQTARVDRTERRIVAQGTTSTESRSVSVQRYLLNGSLYESSEQIARQFGSEWVKTNISTQFEQVFEQFDSARRAVSLLRNATGTLAGQTTIDGQRVYAINATVDSSAVVETRANIVGADQFQLSIWLSADSSLPLRIGEDSTLTLSTNFGEVTQRTDSVIDHRFGPVDISLPEEAEDAPLASEVTNQ